MNTNHNNRSFHQYISAKFTQRNSQSKPEKKKESRKSGKSAEISRIPSPIPPRLSKEVFRKLKFFQKKGKKVIKNSKNQKEQIYAQTFFSNIKEILKIKKNFPSLSLKKIEEVYKTINELRKEKPKINMTTKRS